MAGLIVCIYYGVYYSALIKVDDCQGRGDIDRQGYGSGARASTTKAGGGCAKSSTTNKHPDQSSVVCFHVQLCDGDRKYAIIEPERVLVD